MARFAGGLSQNYAEIGGNFWRTPKIPGDKADFKKESDTSLDNSRVNYIDSKGFHPIRANPGQFRMMVQQLLFHLWGKSRQLLIAMSIKKRKNYDSGVKRGSGDL